MEFMPENKLLDFKKPFNRFHFYEGLFFEAVINTSAVGKLYNADNHYLFVGSIEGPKNGKIPIWHNRHPFYTVLMQLSDRICNK